MMNKKRKTRIIFIFFLLLGLLMGIIIYKNKKKPIIAHNESVYKEYIKSIDSLLAYDKDKAREKIEVFYKTVLEKQDTLWLAYVYNYKAEIKQGSALFYLNKARVYAQKINDSILMGKIDYKIGNLYNSGNKYVISLEYYLNADKIFFNKEHLNGLGHVNNMLGSVYFSVNEYHKASVYYNKAEKYFKQIKDTLGEAISLTNKSRVLLKTNKYDLARKDLLKALSVFENLADTTKIIHTLLFLGDTEHNDRNSKLSLFYTDRAYEMALKSKDTLLEKHILLHYGQIYERYDYDKAIQFYEKGIKEGKEEMIDLDSFKNLAILWIQKNEYKKAYKYMERYYQLSDSIKGFEVRSKMEELQWKNELQQQHFENQLLKKESEINKQNYKNRFIIYTILTIFIISVIGLLYFNKVKSSRIIKLENNNLLTKIEFEKELKELREKEFKEELAAKARELNGINIQLLAKNQFFKEVRHILEKSTEYENIEIMAKELWLQLDKLDNQEQDWEQFKEVFEKIHPTFFETISKEAPALTKTEMRICAYIKINMDNSEIATLLNIGHRSLITIRSRIRKKLNLERDKSLECFIKSW
ncbi:tetratricopeptide repeat protein [Myroides indicus]|nr:hypothetical protein [Myroides indicus]